MRGIIVIQPNGDISVKEFEARDVSLADMQELVGGRIEHVDIMLPEELCKEEGVELTMICDEEHFLKDLPYNPCASLFSCYENDIICGPALILGSDDESFVTLDGDTVSAVKEYLIPPRVIEYNNLLDFVKTLSKGNNHNALMLSDIMDALLYQRDIRKTIDDLKKLKKDASFTRDAVIEMFEAVLIMSLNPEYVPILPEVEK